MKKDGIRHLTYSKWLEDYDFDIYLDGDKIIKDNKKINLNDLKKEIINIFKEDIIEEFEYYKENGMEDKSKEILKFLNLKTIDDLK
jgi:hypothetical protein